MSKSNNYQDIFDKLNYYKSNQVNILYKYNQHHYYKLINFPYILKHLANLSSMYKKSHSLHKFQFDYSPGPNLFIFLIKYSF
jgi:hypothetical protein